MSDISIYKVYVISLLLMVFLIPGLSEGACDADPGGTYIEAENFTDTIFQGGTYTTSTADPGFLGDAYLLAGTSSTSSSCPSTSEGKKYELFFPETGIYKVWIRGKSSGGTSDSVFIGVDGQCVGALNHNRAHGSWVWSNSIQNTSPTGNNTILIDTVDTHELNVWIRESGHKLDAIYITKGTETPDDDSKQKEVNPTDCEEEICNNNIDDDGDGDIDCEDTDCIGEPVCVLGPPVIKEVAFELMLNGNAIPSAPALNQINEDVLVVDLLRIYGENLYETNGTPPPIASPASTINGNGGMNGEFPKVTLGLNSEPLHCYPGLVYENDLVLEAAPAFNDMNGTYQVLTCDLPYRVESRDYRLKLCNAPMVCDSRMVTKTVNISQICEIAMYELGGSRSDICIINCAIECERSYNEVIHGCWSTYDADILQCQLTKDTCDAACNPSDGVCLTNCSDDYNECTNDAINVQFTCINNAEGARDTCQNNCEGEL